MVARVAAFSQLVARSRSQLKLAKLQVCLLAAKGKNRSGPHPTTESCLCAPCLFLTVSPLRPTGDLSLQLHYTTLSSKLQSWVRGRLHFSLTTFPNLLYRNNIARKKRKVIKYREDVLTMNNGMYCNLLMQILARDSMFYSSLQLFLQVGLGVLLLR